MPPGVPLTNERVVAMIFRPARTASVFPGELIMHGLVHELVAGAHDLREAEPANQSDEEAGGGGLAILRPARQSTKARVEEADGAREHGSGECPGNTEPGVGDQFGGMNEGGDRDPEERVGAEESAHHDHAGYGGEHDRA